MRRVDYLRYGVRPLARGRGAAGRRRLRDPLGLGGLRSVRGPRVRWANRPPPAPCSAGPRTRRYLFLILLNEVPGIPGSSC